MGEPRQGDSPSEERVRAMVKEIVALLDAESNKEPLDLGDVLYALGVVVAETLFRERDLVSEESAAIMAARFIGALYSSMEDHGVDMEGWVAVRGPEGPGPSVKH